MKNRKTERRKTLKDLRGDLRREHNKLLGGAAKGNHLREQAAALRRQHHLCLHGDDERVYSSQQEADADKEPAVTCVDCRKPKLRVVLVQPALLAEMPEQTRAAVRDIARHNIAR